MKVSGVNLLFFFLALLYILLLLLLLLQKLLSMTILDFPKFIIILFLYLLYHAH
jgi:hypothetical protein